MATGILTPSYASLTRAGDAAADASTLISVLDQVAGAGPFLAGKYAGHLAACRRLPDARAGAVATVRPGPGSAKELLRFDVPEHLHAAVLRSMTQLLEPTGGEARAHLVSAIDNRAAT